MTDTEHHHRLWVEWQAAFSDRDARALSELYAEDGILEGPIIPMLMGQETGVLRGRAEILRFAERSFEHMKAAAAKTGDAPKLWRPDHYFSSGRTLIWEHPRLAPHGEQIDVIQALDIDDGLIAHHRTYWGWRAIKPFTAGRTL